MASLRSWRFKRVKASHSITVAAAHLTAGVGSGRRHQGQDLRPIIITLDCLRRQVLDTTIT